MSTWLVWGDFVHTRPQKIGSLTLADADSAAAKRSAKAQGFDFDQRTDNGFEPWASTFEGQDDDGQEFEFASCPVVRGWQRA